jgi:signal transduction histidine kinase
MIELLRRSIPHRILASLLAIYLTTYLATALIVYSGARSSVIDSATSTLQQLAEVKYERLDNVVEALATDVAAWSQLDVMNDLVSGDIDKRVARSLEQLKAQYDLPGDLYAFDAAGYLVASTHAVPPRTRQAIPPVWKDLDQGRLILLGKHADPMNGGDILAFIIPVEGSFDKNFKIGTIVLSYPWPAIEKLLFSPETGTILLDMHEGGRVLAVDPAVIAGRDRGLANPSAGHIRHNVVIGHSTSKAGIVEGWEVESLRDTGTVTRPLRHVGIELALLGGALGIPIFVLGRWLSNRLTAPVRELTRVAREIADTDKLDARVPVTSEDELGMLARSFNRMTENLEHAANEREHFVGELEALNQSLEAKVAARTGELEAAVAAQKRLIGDISHEIKSPLARLGVALGLARLSRSNAARHFDRMESEIDNVSALASELLTLASLEDVSGVMPLAEVDINALVARIIADAIYELPGRAGDVRVLEPDGPIAARANWDLLRRAIENVVRNALFYTARGTPVTLIIAGHGGRVSIGVTDQGPGVPEEALSHLFEPFYRVDEARARKTGGSGVGLAICQRVVEVHGGTVRARNNTPTGLIVEIEIPRTVE